MKTFLAKYLMNQFGSNPHFDRDKVGLLQEVFNHEEFVNGSSDQQKEIMYKSSRSKYEDELNFPIDNYFGFQLLPYLRNKNVLDLGCFVGGRTVAWLELYKINYISGVDINQVFIDAAQQFAISKNANADFRKGFGENLPYKNDQFDAIITFDVFEHVQNLQSTMKECHRVLKTGGQLLVIFPTYYQPKEHHLNLVTKLPGLQYLFSGKTLVRSYYEILQERDENSNWYKRNSPDLKDWEKGNTINGTSFRQFKQLIKKQDWKIVFQGRKPLGTVGRSLENRKWLKAFFKLLTPLTYVPFIQEIFLHRITFILEKK